MRTVESYVTGDAIKYYSYEFHLEQFPEHGLRRIYCNGEEIFGEEDSSVQHWYHYDAYYQTIDVRSIESKSVKKLIFKLYKEQVK
jgi:hypothetical protein